MDQSPEQSAAKTADTQMARLYLMFALSGAAGLVYEVVWFQFLRSAVGANAQALAVLLACYMGGLFVGSAFCARWISARRNALWAYGWLEFRYAGLGGYPA